MGPPSPPRCGDSQHRALILSLTEILLPQEGVFLRHAEAAVDCLSYFSARSDRQTNQGDDAQLFINTGMWQHSGTGRRTSATVLCISVIERTIESIKSNSDYASNFCSAKTTSRTSFSRALDYGKEMLAPFFLAAALIN